MTTISDERIREIANDIFHKVQRISEYSMDFARAIEREAYANGQRDMREAAAQKCHMLATTKGNDCFGDAVECVMEIRALPIKEPAP